MLMALAALRRSWSMASCSASKHLIDRIRHGVVDAATGTPQQRLCVVLEMCGRSEFAAIGHDGADAVGDELENGPNVLMPGS
jgi:hypothetical protein